MGGEREVVIFEVVVEVRKEVQENTGFLNSSIC